MRVCVCFKVVDDLEKIVPSDWQNFEEIPDTGYVGKIIGYFDEIALELALRLKDLNDDVSCIAVILGELPARLAKKIYAAGFDEVVCLDCSNTEFAPKQVAKKLSNYLNTQNFEVVITGKQTARMDSGTVPFYIASNMKLPILSNVFNCTLEYNRLCVEYETDGGYSESDVKVPIILSVGNNDIKALRLATFSAQIEAGKRIVTHIAEESVKSLEHAFQKKKSHKCYFVKGNVESQIEFIKEMTFREDAL